MQWHWNYVCFQKYNPFLRYFIYFLDVFDLVSYSSSTSHHSLFFFFLNLAWCDRNSTSHHLCLYFMHMVCSVSYSKFFSCFSFFMLWTHFLCRRCGNFFLDDVWRSSMRDSLYILKQISDVNYLDKWNSHHANFLSFHLVPNISFFLLHRAFFLSR